VVAVQLAARYAIPRIRLRRRGTVFLLTYAVIGVIVPLLWSLNPAPGESQKSRSRWFSLTSVAR
jgi:hypothetical protein